MLRAAAIVERLGVPTASIIGSGFLKQAEVILKGIGVPLAIGVYPGAPMVDSEAELMRKVEESLAPGLLKGLTGDAPVDADKGADFFAMMRADDPRISPRSSRMSSAPFTNDSAMKSAPASSAGSSRARNALGRPDRSSVSGRDRPAAARQCGNRS